MTTQVSTTRHDASSGALAKTATLTTAKSPTRAWKAIAPIAVAVVLALLPVPTGLPHHDVQVPANHLQMRDTYECDGFHCDYLRR
jgi:hypothetical protein